MRSLGSLARSPRRRPYACRRRSGRGLCPRGRRRGAEAAALPSPPVRAPGPAAPPAEGPPAAGAGGRHNLPLARTSFIGRERETLEVKRLLAMTGLWKVTGGGGAGQTVAA